jgi:methionyl aminopeptidase
MASDPATARLLGVARAGRIVDQVLTAVHAAARPGVVVGDLDRLARSELARLDARPAMLGFRDALAEEPFPAALSVCVNDEISGASNPARRLEPGDLVTADLAAEHRGWHADAARTWVIPGGDPAAADRRSRLARASAEVTRAGLAAVRPGGDWSDAVGAMAARAAGLGVATLRGFHGHALGRSMHAPPRLPNHPADLAEAPPVTLEPGLAFTIEPVVGWTDSGYTRDGWLDRTADGSDACFTEITVVVGGRAGRPARADPDRPGRGVLVVSGISWPPCLHDLRKGGA